MKNLFRNSLARRGFFTRFELKEEDKPVEPEILLGRTTLDKALVDSFDSPEASAWFDANCSSFGTICFIAVMEPQEVEKKFLRIKKLSTTSSMDKKTFDLISDLMIE